MIEAHTASIFLFEGVVYYHWKGKQLHGRLQKNEKFFSLPTQIFDLKNGQLFHLLCHGHLRYLECLLATTTAITSSISITSQLPPSKLLLTTTISTYFPHHLPLFAQFAAAQVQLFLLSFLLSLYLSANWVFTNYQMPPPRWVVKIGEEAEDDLSEEETLRLSLSLALLQLPLLNGQSTPHRLASSLSAPFTTQLIHEHSNWRWTRPIGNK